MKYRFSAYWSDELKQAILQEAPKSYSMKLAGKDAIVCREVVNQGIDSHLEACFLPSMGDNYMVNGSLLECQVSPKSLAVLVRRLMERSEEEAQSLASAICSTLGIELI